MRVKSYLDDKCFWVENKLVAEVWIWTEVSCLTVTQMMMWEQLCCLHSLSAARLDFSESDRNQLLHFTWKRRQVRQNKCWIKPVRVRTYPSVVTLEAVHQIKVAAFASESSRPVQPAHSSAYIVFSINKFKRNVQPTPTQSFIRCWNNYSCFVFFPPETF